MGKVYFYNVYGLNIKSDIQLNEFVEVDKCNNVDINIKEWEPPEELKSRFKEDSTTLVARNKILFDIKNIATYEVCNGNEIHYNIHEEGNPYHLKVFLMCSCIGFAMIQRDKLAIHGGVVAIDDKAVIITGDKGAGKSSLTTGLRKKGYKFISDDVAAIEFAENIMVNAGFPYQKLCEDTAINMGYDTDKYFSFMSDKEKKYVIPVKDDFKDSSTKLEAIFQITKGNVDKVSIEEIKSSKKVAKIIENIYRVECMDLFGGLNPRLFKKCVNLAKNVKFYKITRPLKGFTINEQIRLIEDYIFNDESSNEKLYRKIL